jgi:hypothetical protein
MVAMPKKAASHIQKMAPGPPEIMAVAQPVMLPVPTWAAIEVATAWKELMPSLPAFSPLRFTLPNSRRKPAPNLRTWMNRVRMVKMMPVPTSRYSSRPFHTKPASSLTFAANRSMSMFSLSLSANEKGRTDPAQPNKAPAPSAARKGLPFTLSFYLRDSAGFPALHLRYSSELLQSHIHP